MRFELIIEDSVLVRFSDLKRLFDYIVINELTIINSCRTGLDEYTVECVMNVRQFV